MVLPWYFTHQSIALLFWFFLMSESFDDDDDDDIIFLPVQPSFESWFFYILCFSFVSRFFLFSFFLSNTLNLVVVFDMGSRLCARCLAMQIEWLLRWYRLFMLIFTFFNNQKKAAFTRRMILRPKLFYTAQWNGTKRDICDAKHISIMFYEKFNARMEDYLQSPALLFHHILVASHKLDNA